MKLHCDVLMALLLKALLHHGAASCAQGAWDSVLSSMQCCHKHQRVWMSTSPVAMSLDRGSKCVRCVQVVTRVMLHGSPASQLRAVDVLLSALQHNPVPLRNFLMSQPDHLLFTCLVE
jgi:hypothetical protein